MSTVELETLRLEEFLPTLVSPSQYRYDTVKEYQQRLQTLVDVYTVKKQKYQRRISIIDVTVYSVSGVIASAGIILSSVTMTALIVIPIVISAVTAITGIFTGVTKKISSCCTHKLKLSTAINAYSELTALISSAITDQEISEEEYSNITSVYNTAIKKLNSDDIHSNENIRNSRRNSKKISNNVEQ